MLSEEILKAISRFKNTIFFQSKESGYYKVDKETMKGIKKIIDYIDNINNDYIKNEKITDEEKNQLDLDYVYNNFISKDKIKAKIEELQEENNNMRQTSDFIIADVLQPQIRVLEELLEDK